MTDSSLGGVVGCLGLRDVDDGAAHGADKGHGTGTLALHQVAGNTSCEQVGAVDVDAPKLLDTVEWVRDGVKVLGEAGRGYEVVNLSVPGNDLVDGVGHGIRVAHCSRSAKAYRNRVERVDGRHTITVVAGDQWNPIERLVDRAERATAGNTHFSAPGFSSRNCCMRISACFLASSSVAPCFSPTS